ncbi:methionine--tRNA ligase [Aminicella lysinilytica]|uniref:Methionine--tRNA ligase n=1 Tax=Aminicella lysinilytica TaxID=433323 RepID=A0A4R6PXB2_9FIRM|nr:methionine--tRNA ligase [Aminicella lysinilytica]TDP50356.1 methionyl-tRNA synthetase [Aminicella lysinilytica]
MSEKKATKGKYYITTPIYYPSSNLHIGHTYCTVMADAMARFKRLCGYDVMFLTGTDEHGLKIQQIAEEKGVSPQEYVDGVVAGIKDLWKTMEISYDDFIRTTEPRHVKRVQAIFNKMNDKGDIYKSEYEGWYCTPCESFWTESQLVDGCCPDCGRPVNKAHEEAYFFRLSKYQDRIIDLFENNPEFLMPDSRRHEMIEFCKQGLEDLCISRSTFDWGIQVPIDPKHVIYVWLDALTNYITALGYPDDPELFNKYWPADVHLVGKEIVRFHSIIWPAMLMSLDLPLPKHVLGHGWLLIDGGKMSKSKGNVVDPVVLIDRYGIDALKYFLLREYTFGQDGVFTNEVMLKRMNFDLANDLGNLVSRTTAMIEKYCGGTVPESTTEDDIDKELKEVALGVAPALEKHMDKFAFNMALEDIWVLVRRANKYIDEKTPWILAKDESKKAELDTCMHNLAESLRIISILISPFMHETAEKIRKQMGLWYADIVWEDAFTFDMMYEEQVKRGDAIFPRLDIEKELEDLDALKGESQEEENIPLELKPEIVYDDFDKIDFRVGTILTAEKHPKADKLLVFQVQMGTEKRQIISGVADDFKPEDMVGKKVIVVANLKPRNLRGMESKGMLMFAENGKRCEMVTTIAEDGSVVD